MEVQEMRPITKRYRERSTGIHEETYQSKKKHIEIGVAISSLGIPFGIAGFMAHEPIVLNSVAISVSTATTLLGAYFLRREERTRHNKMLDLLRRAAEVGNVTAQEELLFHTKN